MSKITFEEAAAKAIEFRNERDWKQFHNPKDLAISISLESSELLELFQWSGTDLEAARKKPEMTEELADVMIYCIYMANALNIDIPEAIQNKIDTRSKRQRANQRSTRNSKSGFKHLHNVSELPSGESLAGSGSRAAGVRVERHLKKFSRSRWGKRAHSTIKSRFSNVERL